MAEFWKNDWQGTRKRYEEWWQNQGTVLFVVAPRKNVGSEMQIEAPVPPLVPKDIEKRWTDPNYRVRLSVYNLSRTYFAGESIPFFDTKLGPGNLATFIGSQPEYSDSTVWFHPCWTDLHSEPELKLKKDSLHFQRNLDLIKEGVKVSDGRFLVSMPDLVENLDILCSLRGTQNTFMELLEHPEEVKRRLKEINQVYFEAFDSFFQYIKDPYGGNVFSAFRIWGPGKTAKVQCDVAAMLSEKMFRDFVMPSLVEQCDWLDYSMFHLDGVDAMHHVDALLEIDSLNAIQWTPQAGKPPVDDPVWYDLYHKILGANKSLQLLGVRIENITRLIRDLGPKGLFIVSHAQSEEQADEIVAAARDLIRNQ